MKNNKGLTSITIVLIIIVVLAVGGITYYIGTKNNSVSKNVEEKNSQSVQNNYDARTGSFIDEKNYIPSTPIKNNSTKCYENSKYFVIAKTLNTEPGSNILVKYKNNTNKNIPCIYKFDSGDFELKNIDGSDYFYALENNFLVLDAGTAASVRGFRVYDLNKRNIIFNDYYAASEGVGLDSLVIKDNTVKYWFPSKQPVTIQNCPELYNSYGGVIVSHTLFNFLTLVKKDLGEIRCVYQE